MGWDGNGNLITLIHNDTAKTAACALVEGGAVWSARADKKKGSGAKSPEQESRGRSGGNTYAKWLHKASLLFKVQQGKVALCPAHTCKMPTNLRLTILATKKFAEKVRKWRQKENHNICTQLVFVVNFHQRRFIYSF